MGGILPSKVLATTGTRVKRHGRWNGRLNQHIPIPGEIDQQRPMIFTNVQNRCHKTPPAASAQRHSWSNPEPFVTHLMQLANHEQQLIAYLNGISFIFWGEHLSYHPVEKSGHEGAKRLRRAGSS